MDIDFKDIVDAELACRKVILGEGHADDPMGERGFGLNVPGVLNVAYAIIACVLKKLGVPGDGAGTLSLEYATEAAAGVLRDFDIGLVNRIVEILQGDGHVVIGAAKAGAD